MGAPRLDQFNGCLLGLANGAAGLPAVDLEAREQLVDLASRLFRRQV